MKSYIHEGQVRGNKMKEETDKIVLGRSAKTDSDRQGDRGTEKKPYKTYTDSPGQEDTTLLC